MLGVFPVIAMEIEETLSGILEEHTLGSLASYVIPTLATGLDRISPRIGEIARFASSGTSFGEWHLPQGTQSHVTRPAGEHVTKDPSLRETTFDLSHLQPQAVAIAVHPRRGDCWICAQPPSVPTNDSRMVLDCS